MTHTASISAMEQFSIAMQTLALRNKIDRFGNPMVDAEHIAWAGEYLAKHMRFIHRKAKEFIRKWQDEAHRRCRQMAGNYSDAIASAWHYLKSVPDIIAKKLAKDTDKRCTMRIRSRAHWFTSENRMQRCPDISGQIYAAKFTSSQYTDMHLCEFVSTKR